MRGQGADFWETTASDALEIHLLGLVDFDSAIRLQDRLVFEIAGRNDTAGALLLCEHPPLVTIGREGTEAQLLQPRQEVSARQLEIRRLNRGGVAFVHAPGQLAVYPILPVNRLGVSLADFRRRLESSVVETAAELQVSAYRQNDTPGVFSRTGQFACFGATIRSWVSYHGLFVNVAPMMDLMRMVDRSCRWTSLAAERQRPTTMHQVREGIIRHLSRQFGYARTHVYTGHPLLHRTKRRLYVHA